MLLLPRQADESIAEVIARVVYGCLRNHKGRKRSVVALLFRLLIAGDIEEVGRSSSSFLGTRACLKKMKETACISKRNVFVEILRSRLASC